MARRCFSASFNRRPSVLIGYRFADRCKEGTDASCLAVVTPSMRDGIDYKKHRHDKMIENGDVVIDREAY